MIPLTEIQAKCEEVFGCPAGDMLNHVRTRDYTDTRKAFRMIADRAGYSTSDMNKFFFDYDHASVYTMLRSAEDQYLTNRIFSDKIMRIEAELKLSDFSADGILMPNPTVNRRVDCARTPFEEHVMLALEEILAILKP